MTRVVDGKLSKTFRLPRDLVARLEAARGRRSLTLTVIELLDAHLPPLRQTRRSR